MIRDKNIEWIRQTYVIHADRFAIGAINSNTIEGFHTGAPQYLEFSTFGFGAISIAAAGDTINVMDFGFPRLIDPANDIGVRVLWGVKADSGVNTSDVVTWLVKYDKFHINEALTDPQATTGLSTVIAAQSPDATTTLRWYRSSRGKINGGLFNYNIRNGGISWSVEADVLTGFDANEVKFLALELDYMPLLCANHIEDVQYRKRLAAD